MIAPKRWNSSTTSGPILFKNCETGLSVPATEMENRWLNNLIAWMQRNGQNTGDRFEALLAEKNRRAAGGAIASASVPVAQEEKVFVTSPPSSPDSLQFEAIDCDDEPLYVRCAFGENNLYTFTAKAAGKAAQVMIISQSDALTLAMRILEDANQGGVLAQLFQEAAMKQPQSHPQPCGCGSAHGGHEPSAAEIEAALEGVF